MQGHGVSRRFSEGVSPESAPWHPEEVITGVLLARCALSGRRRLAGPVEDLHDQGELPLEVRIELIGVAHGEEPLVGCHVIAHLDELRQLVAEERGHLTAG